VGNKGKDLAAAVKKEGGELVKRALITAKESFFEIVQQVKAEEAASSSSFSPSASSSKFPVVIRSSTSPASKLSSPGSVKQRFSKSNSAPHLNVISVFKPKSNSSTGSSKKTVSSSAKGGKRTRRKNRRSRKNRGKSNKRR
jgi:hypothetical protein